MLGERVFVGDEEIALAGHVLRHILLERVGIVVGLRRQRELFLGFARVHGRSPRDESGHHRGGAEEDRERHGQPRGPRPVISVERM